MYATPGVIILLHTPLASSLWSQINNFLPKFAQNRQLNNDSFPLPVEIGATVGAATFAAILFLDVLSKGLADLSPPDLVDYEDCGEVGVTHEDQCWWDWQGEELVRGW